MKREYVEKASNRLLWFFSQGVLHREEKKLMVNQREEGIGGEMLLSM